MNDETSVNDEEQEKGPLGGERLRIARRAKDVSVMDIAKELHLDEAKVRALERNDFDVLGAPVFAKGHLRKYAEMVGVDVDDIMTDYYQMTRSAGVLPIVGPKLVRSRDINPAPWLGGALVVILLTALLYWWFGIRTTEPVVSVEPASLAPFTRQPVNAAAEDEASAQEPVRLEETQTPLAEAATTVAPPPTTAERLAEASASYQPTPGAPQVTVNLAFTGDCWTEVSDAGGRRLFYDLGTEGRVVTLSGDAPIRVILGDSENVEVTVDDRLWPIPASARTGRLARLTINPR